jgi:hypothetical protein
MRQEVQHITMNLSLLLIVGFCISLYERWSEIGIIRCTTSSAKTWAVQSVFCGHNRSRDEASRHGTYVAHVIKENFVRRIIYQWPGEEEEECLWMHEWVASKAPEPSALG